MDNTGGERHSAEGVAETDKRGACFVRACRCSRRKAVESHLQAVYRAFCQYLTAFTSVVRGHWRFSLLRESVRVFRSLRLYPVYIVIRTLSAAVTIVATKPSETVSRARAHPVVQQRNDANTRSHEPAVMRTADRHRRRRRRHRDVFAVADVQPTLALAPLAPSSAIRALFRAPSSWCPCP